ncbi:(2Fe-2S)-binding protein [Plantactinospora sp. S1510]|uniref:(2Fe-2S)-binding protein n=1 Tax=Plantactinospora alkalitolerans TaxID=2789879 RepID=A0ABS0H307_9ACTN|nr:(2Fe-2S)-binding protein [Plantactinospora alkalitolerans]
MADGLGGAGSPLAEGQRGGPVKSYVEAASAVQTADTAVVRGPNSVVVRLSVNGTVRNMLIEPRVSLLDALRDRLDLTGAKKGCNQGACGACTVWVDKRRVLACLTLAITCETREVTTIEGLSDGVDLHPMQQAFVTQDAFQCGYCTPGQIMSAVAFLAEGHAADDAQIREWMSGNICRCAAYPNIRAAIRQVRDDAATENPDAAG